MYMIALFLFAFICGALPPGLSFVGLICFALVAIWRAPGNFSPSKGETLEERFTKHLTLRRGPYALLGRNGELRNPAFWFVVAMFIFVFIISGRCARAADPCESAKSTWRICQTQLGGKLYYDISSVPCEEHKTLHPWQPGVDTLEEARMKQQAWNDVAYNQCLTDKMLEEVKHLKWTEIK